MVEIDPNFGDILPVAFSDIALTNIFRSAVCLSSESHSCPYSFNTSTDEDVIIWRVHLQGTMSHCVRWGP